MKVFWSWQSDHPGNISRHFVRKAIVAALEELAADPDVEEPLREAEIDHDRKDISGSPDLVDAILKKIRRCQAFVADVTPVGQTLSEPPKKLINSNVAVELGYALAEVGDTQMLFVMNSHFGQRADIPFDLQHKAAPIFYSLGPEADKAAIKAEKKKLTGILKTALRDILQAVDPNEGAVSRFDLGDVTVEKRPSPRSGQGVQYVTCISVANGGTTHLDNCLAKITKVCLRDELDVSLNLPRAIQTFRQSEMEGQSGTFRLRRGEHKKLVIASRAIASGDQPICLEFEGGERRKLRDTSVCEIFLEVYGIDTPIRQWWKVSKTGDGKLSAERVDAPSLPHEVA